MTSDEQLIQGCKDNKSHAYEALYKKYAMTLMAIARRYAHSNFEAEDILQEAFIKIFTKIKTYESKGSFEGWLKRIVVNTAINHYHANASKRKHVEYEGIQVMDESVGDVVSKMTNDELLGILRQLPEAYVIVFNLYVIEGYTHHEIGEMLNITEGTSKSRLSRGKEMLRELLLKNKVVVNG
jgi:RNA polymerase sigma factor (sigma-70 family)